MHPTWEAFDAARLPEHRYVTLDGNTVTPASLYTAGAGSARSASVNASASTIVWRDVILFERRSPTANPRRTSSV